MKLHPVTHHENMPHNKWCGPAAISAITGNTAEWAAALIADARSYGKPATILGVQGVHEYELRRVLTSVGYTVRNYTFGSVTEHCPTLAAWLKRRRGDERRMTAIVTVGHHFVVVRGRKLVDSHTKSPVFLSAAPHRRKRVRNVIWIEDRPGRKPAEVFPAAFAPSKRKRRTTATKRKPAGPPKLGNDRGIAALIRRTLVREYGYQISSTFEVAFRESRSESYHETLDCSQWADEADLGDLVSLTGLGGFSDILSEHGRCEVEVWCYAPERSGGGLIDTDHVVLTVVDGEVHARADRDWYR